jgi:hypothetical protein
MTLRTKFLALPVCAFVLVSCGGSTPEPSTADSANEPAAEAEAPKQAESAAPVEAPAEEPAEPAYDGANPRNVLLHEGTAFMLNHRASDMGVQAEEKCGKKAGDDVAKKANCLSAAINKMDREGMMFDEDEEGKWWFIRIGIVKGAKVEYNRVPIEMGEASGKSVTMKVVGADKASRRKGTVPSEMTFEVPDEYTVILQDPSRGKMVFEPKMGLFNE